jgi:hypothetical protein
MTADLTSIIVEALDSSGNIATGYTGTIKFTDSVTGQTLPSNYTFTPGDAGYHAFERVKLTKVGKQTIRVEDTLTNTILGSVTIDMP